ncbi:hypothetical protein BC936DRAFT_137382 [Jimgerdemannia flammicorona]|uniref:Uncharacterized protein n=1 Tax=Jimgerdemannia flammicorona TaxID=994334 RepID=A0A433CXI5_9FUNG|nr:hypothetical protein BC936DRAFT_137382 [Jimgerdemannia flammicorona]
MGISSRTTTTMDDTPQTSILVGNDACNITECLHVIDTMVDGHEALPTKEATFRYLEDFLGTIIEHVCIQNIAFLPVSFVFVTDHPLRHGSR